MVTKIVQQQLNQSMKLKLAPSLDHALRLTDFIIWLNILFLFSLITTNWSNRPEKYDFVFISLSLFIFLSFLIQIMFIGTQ